ncbi:MAG: hypothetical protein C0501_06050 [Isosphaera sp.]|nr:hypothetical protein [Isosphaera sp.]
MTTTKCPHCGQLLAASLGDAPPAFCMHCGGKLRDTPSTLGRSNGSHGSRGSSAGSGIRPVPAAPQPPPESVAGYRLTRFIGAGGMGEVYEAEDPETGDRVAVKLLSAELAASPTAVERFLREGQLASRLAHPRCVFVLAVGADAGRPYIVMELMPGETLKDVMDRQGRLPPDEAVARILEVIDGLAEAHRVGMIHRDVKPSNCFLTPDGGVKVGDFGLSKSLAGGGDQNLTRTGAFLGTVLYAAPEQIKGEPLDYRADVYAVCATLYYLLSGRAPFHHENPTAVVARVISEDAPPLRRGCPDVPRALEAVVMRGLERDRARRWGSLDELRDALVAVLPSRQHPARPRSLAGAFALDLVVLLALLAVPAEVAGWWAGADRGWLGAVIGVVVLGYFAVGEGVFGATPGKWLLGLRVSRVGQAGPPGLGRGVVRTGVFFALLGLLAAPLALQYQLARVLGPALGGGLGGFVLIAAAAGLLAQLRARGGHRGLHDRASGCHVTRRPIPPRKLRLVFRPLVPPGEGLPAPPAPLPKSVGGYRVTGRVAVDPSGEQVWGGVDDLLGRAVLIRLRPGAGPMPSSRPDLTLPVPGVPGGSGMFRAYAPPRPTRLRPLGSGRLKWAGAGYEWAAFAAPLGGPLADAVDQDRPLRWADARFLLEQLVEEFRASESDGTTPARLGVDQVWAETGGRVQLLDCPVAGRYPPAASPVALLREVASLALEGRPRSDPKPVRAAVPAHAVGVLDRLFTTTPRLADLQKELAETHAHPPEVTRATRAAHLGMQAAAVFLPLFAMFALGFAAAPLAARNDGAAARRAELTLPQQWFLDWMDRNIPPDRRATAGLWESPAARALAVLALIPVGLAVGAAGLRGGVSMAMAGIRVVRDDGRPATRWQCGVRAALVWFPVGALLLAAPLLHLYDPGWWHVAAGLWLLALGLLPVYVAVALRNPDRPPQDRMVGTHLVPA